MKRAFQKLGIFVAVFIIIWNIGEVLAFPAFLVVIGLLNSYPWQYYAFFVGGYIFLYALVDLVTYFLFKSNNEKYAPLIKRRYKKFKIDKDFH